MPKFEVHAYSSKHYCKVVEAKTEEQAKEIAEINDDWDEDYEYYNFAVSHAEKIEDED